MKTAFITGINGMDGSHLADFLLEKGYSVYGMERRSSNTNDVNTKHLKDNLRSQPKSPIEASKGPVPTE